VRDEDRGGGRIDVRGTVSVKDPLEGLADQGSEQPEGAGKDQRSPRIESSGNRLSRRHRVG